MAITLAGETSPVPETVKFTLQADGSYRCNREGDQSGVYLKSADYEGGIAALRNVRSLANTLVPALSASDEKGAKGIQQLKDLISAAENA